MDNSSIYGVDTKKILIKKSIINFYIYNKGATIADLSKEFNLSGPTVAKIISEMIEEGFIIDYGKLKTCSGGRRPNLYGLNPESGYFVGVDIKKFGINIGIVNFKGDIVDLQTNISFKNENTIESFNALCEIIQTFINKHKSIRNKILDININISGRINAESGYSYSIFYFGERPLTDLFYEKLGYQVFIDNNTRAMLYGEYMSNNTNNAKNIIFVNISWGLGISIMINGQLYYGESGFSGEFGHISVFDNEELCHCGKKGCLETETSGSAIHRIFMQRVLNGENSILSASIKGGNNLTLSDIIDAVNKEDILAIDIIEEAGNKLGKYIAGLINIFNPGLVIIGGELSQTGDYISLPIISAINKFSLNLANKDSVITISKLKDKAGVIGACMLARNNYLKLSQIGYKY